jgi:2-C-methyl-D-erythritol 4-phosphate cytidylyltransferase
MTPGAGADALPRNVAVLLAGGVGARVGQQLPKQLIRIAGRPILEHALAALNNHPAVDDVLIVMVRGYLDPVRAIVHEGAYGKVADIIEGADTRNGSTLRALKWLDGRECNVLFHDAVRPLVTPRIISECFQALATYEAVDVAIPSADTIIEVRPDDTISDIPPRARLRRGQTPQAFRASVITRAYALAQRDPDFVATDDCTVVLRYLPDVTIVTVQGDERNIKVTEPLDVYIADKLFQLTSNDLPAPRTEADYRAALSGKVMVVFGGSHGIGAEVARRASGFGATPPSVPPPPVPPSRGVVTSPPQRVGSSRSPVVSTSWSTRLRSSLAAGCWRRRRRRSTRLPRSTTSARCSSRRSCSRT